jgi:hypothetical protein
MICPCCGSQVETQVHPAFELLATAAHPPGQVARRALEVLIANFGEWVPMHRLVAAVYHDRIDGGSLAAKNTVSSMLCRQKRRIAALGLKVIGRQFSGYRVVWLHDVEIRQGRSSQWLEPPGVVRP